MTAGSGVGGERPSTASEGGHCSGEAWDRETFQGVMTLPAYHPDLTLARLREVVEAKGNGRRRRVDVIRPRTTAEVVALLEVKVITRAEARRYLLLR